MDHEGEDPPPFWLRQTDHHHHHHQRRVSSMFLNTGVLVIILIVTAVIFLAIAIPSVVSLSQQLFSPSLVKKSWSSLNVVLVIFAIVCGFLGRKDEEHTPTNSPVKKDEHLEKIQYNNHFSDARLRRSSSSYPNLRLQESNYSMIKGDKWRFNDDTNVDNHFLKGFEVIKDIEVDNFMTKTQELYAQPPSPLPTSSYWPSPPPPPPPPPPPLPPRRGHSSVPSSKNKVIHQTTFETIGHGRYKWINSGARQPKPKKAAPPPPPPPPPPPQPPPLRSRQVVDNYTENKDFFSSFYYQSKKKKKHKRRSYENFENVTKPSSPPPPPPPPHKAASSIYRSKSTPEFPPPFPPPPSPPHNVFNHIFSSKKVKQQKKVNPPPRKPVNKIPSFMNDHGESGGGGDESPMRPIQPPPPPPPFKMKPWRFVKKGDYVKTNYATLSSSSSLSSEDESSLPARLFSPTPSRDVNIKAQDFIAKFRAKLNHEKSNNNSINLKHVILPASPLRTDNNSYWY